MADAVTSQVILDGDRQFVGKYTNISDGTGETAVTKITVSSLAKNQFGKACNALSFTKVHVSLAGMSLSILWGGTPNLPALVLGPGMHTFDFHKDIGIPNNAATPTGNVLFTTLGAAANSTYTVVLEASKHYVAA